MLSAKFSVKGSSVNVFDLGMSISQWGLDVFNTHWSKPGIRQFQLWVVWKAREEQITGFN